MLRGFLRCFNIVSRVLQGSVKFIPKGSQESLKAVSREFQEGFKRISRKVQWCFKEAFRKFHNQVSRGFLGEF